MKAILQRVVLSSFLMRIIPLLLLLTACSSQGNQNPEKEDSPVFRNMDAEFAGDAACYDCHTDLWEGFREHGMAQSYYPLTPENAVEDFMAPPLWHEASGFWYRIYQEGDAFYQEEYRLGAGNEKTHQLRRRMDFVVGSGYAARTYLSASGGRLYELPVTWYTQTGTWDFSPGYADHNKRFDRLIPDRCMACHNSFPESVPHVEGKYQDVPLGIGCERCHGPGSLHVEERLSNPEPLSSIDNTIVNPAHLDLTRQLDVCQQCHLQTTVSVLREGRNPFGFRPSKRLEDHVALFFEERPQASGEIGVISHADRMTQSACFLAMEASSNPMTCVTCHNPHEGFRDQGPSYFNDTCLSCHATQTLPSEPIHTSTSNCISCHMPRVAAEDAPHSSFTDHWIRVISDVPEPLAAHNSTPLLEPYYERDAEGRYQALAYLILGTQRADTLLLQKGITLMEEELSQKADTTGEALYLLGYTYWSLSRFEEALPRLEQAVERNPSIPERLNTLAQTYEAMDHNPSKTESLYRQALSIEPALADIRVNYGRFLETRARLEEAAEQYRLAAAEKPWLAKAHYNLGTAHLQLNAFNDGEAALLRVLELEPDHPRALGNLGQLYAVQGRTEEAHTLFRRAVAVAPENATALGNLGTYYLNQDNLAEAIALLSRATQADPSHLTAILNLSLAYFRNEDYSLARQYAEKALAIDPENAMARQIIDAI